MIHDTIAEQDMCGWLRLGVSFFFHSASSISTRSFFLSFSIFLRPNILSIKGLIIELNIPIIPK